ncbi:MAG: alkaline phosphatase family protein [bacterium]
MKRRIIIEVMVGMLLAGVFFYWLYIRPMERREILPINDSRVGKSIVTNRHKVLVIGVSGMSWDIAMDLANDGRMPNLARMIRHGSHGAIEATPPLISPSLWNNLATGRKRKDHGIVNYSTKIPFKYQEVRMTGRFRKVPAIWDIAEFAGRNVGLINWSTVAEAPGLKDSVVIAEGFEPDSTSGKVHPEEWTEKALSAPVPRFLPYEKLIGKTNDKRIKNAYHTDRKVFSMAYEVMREKKPDLMMVHFQNPEMVSQIFYKYARPYSLDHYEPVSDEERDRYKDVLDMHYEFTDRLIGGLLSLSDQYTVIVVSEHGLSPSFPPHNIFPDLNLLMERMGYLDYYGVTCEEILKNMMERGELKVPSPASANIFGMCQQLSNRTEEWIADGASRMEPAAVEAYLGVHFDLAEPSSEKEKKRRQKEMVLLSDKLLPPRKRQEIRWDRTRVWNIRDFEKELQGLYINLEGREPQGTVPHESFHSFRKKVIKELRSLRTDQGRRLFQKVKANHDKGKTPMTRADTPDILVKFDREALFHDYALEKADDPDPIPLPAIRWVYSDVSALPSPEGLIAISGENASTFKHVDMEGMDFLPTLLWLMGMPVGADMPGEVKKEAFDKSIRNRKALYIESWDRVLRK